MLMGVPYERVEKPFEAQLEEAPAEAKAPEVNPFPGRKWPRIGIYEPWQPNSDSGWTQWVFDRLQIPYTVLRNSDIAKGELGRRFDTVVFASQSMASILHGYRAGENATRGGSGATGETPAPQRPEYTGGIGVAGIAALDVFVRQGGRMVAFDSSTELPVQMFGLPVRPLISDRDDPSPNGYFCPGSILRLSVDGSEVLAFSSGGQAWDVTLLPSEDDGSRAVKVLARYAAKNVLASGWLSGERTIAGRAALVEARHGQGHIVLFGFRPQFRGQTWGTFGLLVDSLGAGR
jgi:hypothetical protein